MNDLGLGAVAGRGLREGPGVADGLGVGGGDARGEVTWDRGDGTGWLTTCRWTVWSLLDGSEECAPRPGKASRSDEVDGGDAAPAGPSSAAGCGVRAVRRP